MDTNTVIDVDLQPVRRQAGTGWFWQASMMCPRCGRIHQYFSQTETPTEGQILGDYRCQDAPKDDPTRFSLRVARIFPASA